MNESHFNVFLTWCSYTSIKVIAPLKHFLSSISSGKSEYVKSRIAFIIIIHEQNVMKFHQLRLKVITNCKSGEWQLRRT